jgi:hypothetical protein
MQLPVGLIPYAQMLTKWAAILNPIISNSILQGVQINFLTMVANTPLQINHGLNRSPIGWFVIDSTAATEVFRTQSFNPTTITLEATANAVISIWVY